MDYNSPFVITISRQLGSGGAYIGQKLAQELGIFYFDREIISQAAKKLSVLEEELESRDEKRSSFWESFMQLSSFNSPETYVPPQFFSPTDRELFRAESEIIQRIAKERSAVIIGRCGSCVLKNHPNHVSIFLHGDFDFRKKRVQALYNITDADAAKMLAESDKRRANYYHALTGQNWTDAQQYDISLDTSKIGVDGSVEVILRYVELVRG